jgi:hypothetical protein
VKEKHHSTASIGGRKTGRRAWIFVHMCVCLHATAAPQLGYSFICSGERCAGSAAQRPVEGELGAADRWIMRMAAPAGAEEGGMGARSFAPPRAWPGRRSVSRALPLHEHGPRRPCCSSGSTLSGASAYNASASSRGQRPRACFCSTLPRCRRTVGGPPALVTHPPPRCSELRRQEFVTAGDPSARCNASPWHKSKHG